MRYLFTATMMICSVLTGCAGVPPDDEEQPRVDETLETPVDMDAPVDMPAMPDETREQILNTTVDATTAGQVDDYVVIYQALSPEQRVGLPDPSTVTRVDATLVEQAAARLPDEDGVTRATSATQRSVSAADESTDSGTCHRAPYRDGLLVNLEWKNKSFLSTVKDQRNRGTCGAFALASAAEAATTLLTSHACNFSEQDLYFHVRGPWSYAQAIKGDGMNFVTALGAMKLNQYRFAHEPDWRYNPSASRKEDPLRDSCVGYAQACSDSYHQGYTATLGQRIAQRSGVYARSFGILGLPSLGFGIDAARAALRGNKSVIVSFDITPMFKAHKHGFVTYEKKEKRKGGHISHLVAYVSNATLARELPAAPAGDGGGYFVIKNSWGECNGDAGYYYVPVSFIREYATSLVSVEFAVD